MIVTTSFGTLALLAAQPTAPITDQLQWFTDVILTDNANEERLALRSRPRQTLKYSIPLRGGKANDSSNTIYGNLRKNWAVPIWTDAQSVGNLASGISSINCNSSDFDFRANSLAFLYNGCGFGILVEIANVAGSSVSLAAPLVSAINNAILMPVRIGWILGVAARRTNGYEQVIDVSFQIDDTSAQYAHVIDATLPTQYLGDDIYFDAPLIESDYLDRSLSQQQDTADFDLGVVFRRTTWAAPRTVTPYRCEWSTREQINAYKKFLYRCQGKFRRFWFPTFENDLRLLNVGNVTSTIVFNSDSFIETAIGRTQVAIQAAGVWYIRALSGVIATSTTVAQATLDSPLNVQAQSITRVSFLSLHRLDADLIELNWNTAGIMQANVQVTEIKA